MAENLTKKELRLKVIELIEKGDATADSLIQATGLKDKKALGRVFAELRIMEKYPVEDSETKIYKLLTEEEYEAHEAEVKAAKKTPKKSRKPSKPPQTRRRQAIIQYNNKLEAMQKAQQKAGEARNNVKLTLKAEIARLQFAVAELDLKDVKLALMKELGIDTLAELDAIPDLDKYRSDQETEPAAA